MLNVKLVVVGGATEGAELPLQLPAILGRSREATIPLPHPLVSRLHCELSEREECLMVRDLGSTNGTFVGSERVEEAAIDHGALLTIGSVTFRAHYQGQSEPFIPGSTTLDEVNSDTEEIMDAATTITRIDVADGVTPPPHRAGQKAK